MYSLEESMLDKYLCIDFNSFVAHTYTAKLKKTLK